MINRFQQGGGFEHFFTVYRPILTESPRYESRRSESERSKSKDDDSSKGKLTEKDLFDMLEKLNGLPNEMKLLSNNLLNMLEVSKLVGNKNITDLATTYIKNLYQVKEAQYNKEYFDHAYERAVNNKSLNDPAIMNGLVYTISKNYKLQPLTPEQWKKVQTSKEYQIATVGNLLWMRSHLPQYANKNDLFRLVESSVGILEIRNSIKNTFVSIGKSEISNDQVIPLEVIQGDKLLKEMIGLGPDGYYKFTLKLTKADDNHINATLYWIYSTLHPNERARLALETEDGTPEQTLNLIKSMLIGTLDIEMTNSIQYLGDDLKLTGTKRNKDGTTGDEDNYAIKVAKGYGTHLYFSINLGDNNDILVYASTMPIIGSNNDEIEVGKTMDNISKSLGSQLDFNSISMGGGIVSAYNLKHIVNRDAKVRTIDYPCKKDDLGRVIPLIDSEYTAKKKLIDEQLKRAGINPYNLDEKYISSKYLTISQVYLNNLMQCPYNPNGSLRRDSWDRFAIFAVATDGNVVENADLSKLLKITNKNTQKSIISSIKDTDKEYSASTGIFGEDFYDGVLWIPIRPGYNAATATLKSDAAVTRQRDEMDLVLSNRVQLTTDQFY